MLRIFIWGGESEGILHRSSKMDKPNKKFKAIIAKVAYLELDPLFRLRLNTKLHFDCLALLNNLMIGSC